MLATGCTVGFVFLYSWHYKTLLKMLQRSASECVHQIPYLTAGMYHSQILITGRFTLDFLTYRVLAQRSALGRLQLSSTHPCVIPSSSPQLGRNDFHVSSISSSLKRLLFHCFIAFSSASTHNFFPFPASIGFLFFNKRAEWILPLGESPRAAAAFYMSAVLQFITTN